MPDLFQEAAARYQAEKAPLADRMRPRTLDEFVGQPHILGPGKLLRRAIEADRVTSLIFFGPPALPEELGKDDMLKEVAKAKDAGVKAPTADHVATVLTPDVLRVPGKYELELKAIDLVEKYSPQEKDLISGFRVPLVK